MTRKKIVIVGLDPTIHVNEMDSPARHAPEGLNRGLENDIFYEVPCLDRDLFSWTGMES